MCGLNDTHTEPNEPISGKPLTQSTLQKGTPFPPFNSNYQLDMEIVCPCCHQVSMEKAYQEAMVPKPGMMGYWQYHCRNPKCEGYGRTLPLAQFTQEFGTQENDHAE